MSVCKRCGAEIEWRRSGARWVPLERDSENGNLCIDAHGRLRPSSAPGMNDLKEFRRHRCEQQTT